MKHAALVLASLLALPALARAQSYECDSALGTGCQTAIHDGHPTQVGSSGAGSVTSTLLVLPGACPQVDRIVDVDLGVRVLHPYVGDLEIVLTHPDGTAVSVLYRPGIGAIDANCPNDDLDVTFDDDDGVQVFNMCGRTIPALRESVLPFNPLSLLDGKARNGTWTLTVRDHAPGHEGVLRGWKLDLPCVADLPDVTVETTDAVVSERGPDDRAVVTVARGGATTRALEVSYMVTGSAALADFEPLPGTISIAAGSASAEIEIRAIEDALDELDETIVLTLLPGAAYELGARDSAVITLIERSDAPAADGGEGGSGGRGQGGEGGAAGGQSGGAGKGDDEPRDGGPDAGDETPAESDDDCACRIAGGRGEDFPFASMTIGALVLGWRLRRRLRHRSKAGAEPKCHSSSTSVPRALGARCKVMHVNATPAKVLVVDDRPDVADALGGLIRSLGHVAEVAYEPAVAIELAQTLQPDIAIVDLTMGELGGAALASKLRANVAGRSLRLIAISGYDRDAARLGTGPTFDDFLTKPPEVEAVVRLLTNFRGKPRGR